MSNSDEQLKLKIDALRKSFVAGLAGRLSELDAAISRIGNEARLVDQASAVKVILEQAHKIAGSAGTFGFDQMSVIASEIEQLCDSILKDAHGPDVDALAVLTERIDALHAEVPK